MRRWNTPDEDCRPIPIRVKRHWRCPAMNAVLSRSASAMGTRGARLRRHGRRHRSQRAVTAALQSRDLALRFGQRGLHLAKRRLHGGQAPLHRRVGIAHRNVWKAQRKRESEAREATKLEQGRFTDHSSLARLLLRRSA